ncbi:hypothetical protein FKM82_014897 [Ascaphus truei]
MLFFRYAFVFVINVSPLPHIHTPVSFCTVKKKRKKNKLFKKKQKKTQGRVLPWPSKAFLQYVKCVATKGPSGNEEGTCLRFCIFLDHFVAKLEEDFAWTFCFLPF